MVMRLEISRPEDIPENTVYDILNRCSWSTFYHSPVNLRIIESLISATILIIIAYIDDQAVGLQPVAIQDGPLGKVVNCLPYFGSYGDALIDPDTSPNIEQEVYDSLIEQCRSMGALCLNVITSPFAEHYHHEEVRSYLNPTFVEERCCQITHIPDYKGEEKDVYTVRVLSLMQGRARTAYRKIIKSGLTTGSVESEAEAMLFAQIHKENIGGRGGIFKTEEFFKRVLAMANEYPDKAELAVVRDGKEIVAGVVLFYFRDTVEYHTTCLLDEYRSIGPLNRIIIDRMVDAGMTGYRYWNFGGTWKTQEGVYKFKQSFGALDHPYFYYTVFFRDIDRIKSMSSQDILSAYPHCYVIPFSELT